ncbi:MAG: tetratricopeptide repeat protein, partial [Syntrophothermus sp.]
MKQIILILLFISLLVPAAVTAQGNINEQIKQEALIHMRNGRFGEAIDLLNKFIAANPRVPEGLKLRGLCYEARGQYEQAVLDLRWAIRLAPGNKEIQTILSRVESKWYPQLLKKIEGHKREIAINPAKGSNYREIGKCFKNMGDWIEAENWYDEFYKRQEATADEVINYSEIMAHNNHIAKAEKILKVYVEKYPNDQRLWSRYGFFTMWLGKIKIAIKAFETALVIKPFFKEAQDGLDQAKGHPYLFEWNDTTARYRKGFQAPPKPQEYAIDRYSRIVKNNPADDEARYQLVQELMKVERMEEAYQHVQVLGAKHVGEEKYQTLYDSVVSHKTRLYNEKIEELTAKLDKEPNNREDVLKLAGYYGNLNDYEKAAALLENYIQANPNDSKINDVRFLLSKMYAWNREFEKSLDPLKLALEAEPDNLDYQLLRAQIAAWTDQDFDLAEKYSKNVMEKYPDKLEPLIVLGSIFIKHEQMDSAKVYLDKAIALAPDHHNVKELQTYYDFRLLAIEETKIFDILVEGRNLSLSGDYSGALVK